MRRLEKDEKLAKVYQEILREQEKNGIIEKVTEPAANQTVLHYLPHQIVEKPGSTTTSSRIVHDASAGENSLNQCLFIGPLAMPPIVDILIKFQAPIIVLSDITKAFLQLSLNKEDRDVVRFLSKKD